jgi:hypothetical protein
MRADKPFRKSFVCGGVLFGIIILIMLAARVEIVAYRFGYILTSCLFPALVTGTWGFFSKKPWSWGRFAATVIGLYLLFAFFNSQGRLQR